MLELSTRVNTDRVTGRVHTAVYMGYIKACGMLAVAVTLSVSMVAQVGFTYTLVVPPHSMALLFMLPQKSFS